VRRAHEPEGIRLSTFQNLARDGVDKYATYFRNNGCLWVFHHIPKTAGSSLTHELSQTLAPYRNIHVRHTATMQPGEHADLLMKEVDNFVADHATKRYMSASGHLRQNHLRRIAETVPGTKVFTFLRDPAARLISDYRYAKTPKHPPHEEFARRYPTIEAYLDDPGQQNKMWKFVRPRNALPDEEVLSIAFKRYAFFGLVSDIDLHFEFLSALTTCPRRPQSRVNVTAGQENNTVDLSPELRTKIETTNHEDFTLFHAVEKVLAERRAEMVEFVKSRREFFLGAFLPAA
jgi:hypothetical protein